MNIFHELTRKPWLTSEGTVVDLHGGSAFALPKATIGLRVFLGVVTVLFSLLVVAYFTRMTLADWRSMPDPWLLWLNTALLVLSSVGMQWARVGVRRGQLGAARTGLLVGGVFAFAFLAGQLIVWQQLLDLGYFAATNPSNAFFYMITGAHGLHLAGGLVAWGRTSAKARRGSGVATVRLSVELCAVYWHFLLVIWLVLFGLLLVT